MSTEIEKIITTDEYVTRVFENLYLGLGVQPPKVEVYTGTDIDLLGETNQFFPFQPLNYDDITLSSGFKISGKMGNEIFRYYPDLREGLPEKIMFGQNVELYATLDPTLEKYSETGGWYLSLALAAIEIYSDPSRRQELELWDEWVLNTLKKEEQLLEIGLSTPLILLQVYAVAGLLDQINNPYLSIPTSILLGLGSGAGTFKLINRLHKLKIRHLLLQHPVATRGVEIYVKQGIRLPTPKPSTYSNTEE